MMRGWSIRAMPVDQARHLPEAQCSPACWRGGPDLPPPESPTVCAFWPVPPGPAAICSILRPWVAVRSENTGMPTAAAALFSILGGNHPACVGKHGVRARHLEQAGRQAVAIGHGGLLDRAPAFVRAQPPGHHAGK